MYSYSRTHTTNTHQPNPLNTNKPTTTHSFEDRDIDHRRHQALVFDGNVDYHLIFIVGEACKYYLGTKSR